ncbi:hypothetical protein M407DRAFT_244205 [Tulasnella calospora MUT 4182]|uniref:Uncharacterized protein n=1 Tax=Tulasnella calospora MUT 4182 TaxID=1051891 RepID=A0A0C3KU85_9AGAM|nr:hypothetical protein M407DRAFT_244205 [Tulasnella calospora MUT 4182]
MARHSSSALCLQGCLEHYLQVGHCVIKVARDRLKTQIQDTGRSELFPYRSTDIHSVGSH